MAPPKRPTSPAIAQLPSLTLELSSPVAYATGDDNSSVSEGVWSIAGEVGLFGGAIGARYAQNDSGSFDDAIINGVCSSGDCEESTLSIGAEYGTGPWGFFVNWAQTIDSDSAMRDGDWGISGEVDYALAPGVDTFLIVEYGSDGGSYTGPRGRFSQGSFDSEFAIGAGMGLSF